MTNEMKGEGRATAMEPRHFTTRRGFVAATSFAGVSLYGLWAVFGMAPLGLGSKTADGAADMDHGQVAPASSAGGHEGHGGGGEGLPIDAYRAMVDEFMERHRTPDGFVEPGAPMTMGEASSDAVASQDHAAMGHGEADVMPIDVFLMAERWSFTPDAIRLRRGATYRFNVMATDVSHGASLQLGIGSHIIRLRRGVLTQRDLVFTEPGVYLMYCTVYCGVGHDQMLGSVVVV